MAAMTHSQCRTQHISYQYGLFSYHCSCTCWEDGKPSCLTTKVGCISAKENDEPGLKTDTGKDPAGNNEGCTDENGKRRKIGEKWREWSNGCTWGWLVPN